MLEDRFAEVLAGAASGDERAFDTLYRDIHPQLLRYLRTLHWELAEDSASEAWIEVARGVSTFDGPEKAFRSWVFAIARRKLIDRIRYEARRPGASFDDVPDAGPPERDVAEEIVERDQTTHAIALIRTLPRDQGEAVMLRVVAGLDHAEVAAVMGKTPGAVRVRVHRGLRRLEREMNEQGLRSVTP